MKALSTPKNKKNSTQETLTVKDVSVILGICTKKVYKMIASKRIPAITGIGIIRVPERKFRKMFDLEKKEE